MMIVNIFKYLNSINYKTKISNFDKTDCPKVLLCYWLSHDSSLLEIINEINKLLWYIDDQNVYEYFYTNVPKKKRFLKWTKKKKLELDSKLDINELKHKLHLSEREINNLIGGSIF